MIFKVQWMHSLFQSTIDPYLPMKDLQICICSQCSCPKRNVQMQVCRWKVSKLGIKPRRHETLLMCFTYSTLLAYHIYVIWKFIFHQSHLGTVFKWCTRGHVWVWYENGVVFGTWHHAWKWSEVETIKRKSWLLYIMAIVYGWCDSQNYTVRLDSFVCQSF